MYSHLIIEAHGAEGEINQIDRIRKGLSQLGVKSINQNLGPQTHLFYANDPSAYDKGIKFKKENPKCKLIFNVLDIPPHCLSSNYDTSRYPYVPHNWPRNFDVISLTNKLKQADVITTICDDVTRQVREYCGLNAVTIYNPIKDVFPADISLTKQFKYLYVGRACDPNKRFQIVVDTLNYLGENPCLLAVAGTENPGFGTYLGKVDDGTLNILYNMVNFFFFPSAYKSIGLPALESVVCKTIPIVCSDDPCTSEFWAPIGLSSNPKDIAKAMIDPNWLGIANNFVSEMSPIYKQKFDKKSIAMNILNAYLEEQILL
jgi:hypothetical protein